MKNSLDRRLHYEAFRSITPDEEGYESFMKAFNQRFANNPELSKRTKENYKKAHSIGITQFLNGIGLLQDKELRFFHEEFNVRTWQHGFGALPSSFNVLEGFFKWNPDLFYFELFDEEEHLFSFFDFIDFVTSKNCSDSIEYFINNVYDEVIYSYNILNEVKEITFNTEDSFEYVIGGVSFIKRENEVFMLIVAGELGDTKSISQNLPDMEYRGQGKSYLKPAENRKHEAVKLFNKDDIWKVNIYVRIDLESKTIDSRYIQKDVGDGFSTITDDVGMLIRSIKDVTLLEATVKQQLENIEKYNAIFEVAYQCLHLPEYFDFYDDQIFTEEHPTSLFNEKLHSTVGQPKYNKKYFFKTKPVYALDRDYIPKTGSFNIKQSELRIQKDGYWQQLDPGQAGKDKNGNVIHNRTWIEKTLSWYETEKSYQLKVKIPKRVSINSGYIYLLRNAAHQLNIFKIGLTTKTVEERANQLSGTGSPDNFIIINRWFVQDCFLAEKLIHDKLDTYRINPSREFFKIELEKAIAIISPIIFEVNNNGT